MEAVEVEEVKPEGHEQFAVRGVAAGVFVVQEHTNKRGTHFDLRLEVEGVMRSWAVPKGPSMDPAVKRMAIEVADHSIEHNDFEGELEDGRVIVWDRGDYEQGGRVRGRRRSSAGTPSSSSTATSSRAALPCSAPAAARSRSGC